MLLGVMCQRHATPLSLYPSITYPQASDHIVTVGVVNTMLFIGSSLSVTLCRIFSRVEGVVCNRTGVIVVPTSFPLLGGDVDNSGSTELDLLCVWCDWAYQ